MINILLMYFFSTYSSQPIEPDSVLYSTVPNATNKSTSNDTVYNFSFDDPEVCYIDKYTFKLSVYFV